MFFSLRTKGVFAVCSYLALVEALVYLGAIVSVWWFISLRGSQLLVDWMLWCSLCMNCGERSFGGPVFIGDALDVFVDECINGRRDVPAGTLECVLMANCFRQSRSWIRDGTIKVVGRCRLWKWSMVLYRWAWCRWSKWWFPVILLCMYQYYFDFFLFRFL